MEIDNKKYNVIKRAIAYLVVISFILSQCNLVAYAYVGAYKLQRPLATSLQSKISTIKGELNKANVDPANKILYALNYIGSNNLLSRGHALLESIAKGGRPFSNLSKKEREILINILYENFRLNFTDVQNGDLPKAGQELGNLKTLKDVFSRSNEAYRAEMASPEPSADIIIITAGTKAMAEDYVKRYREAPRLGVTNRTDVPILAIPDSWPSSGYGGALMNALHELNEQLPELAKKYSHLRNKDSQSDKKIEDLRIVLIQAGGFVQRISLTLVHNAKPDIEEAKLLGEEGDRLSSILDEVMRGSYKFTQKLRDKKKSGIVILNGGGLLVAEPEIRDGISVITFPEYKEKVAGSQGVVTKDNNGKVIGFLEKPSIEQMREDPELSTDVVSANSASCIIAIDDPQASGRWLHALLRQIYPIVKSAEIEVDMSKDIFVPLTLQGDKLERHIKSRANGDIEKENFYRTLYRLIKLNFPSMYAVGKKDNTFYRDLGSAPTYVEEHLKGGLLDKIYNFSSVLASYVSPDAKVQFGARVLQSFIDAAEDKTTSVGVSVVYRSKLDPGTIVGNYSIVSAHGKIKVGDEEILVQAAIKHNGDVRWATVYMGVYDSAKDPMSKATFFGRPLKRWLSAHNFIIETTDSDGKSIEKFALDGKLWANENGQGIVINDSTTIFDLPLWPVIDSEEVNMDLIEWFSKAQPGSPPKKYIDAQKLTFKEIMELQQDTAVYSALDRRGDELRSDIKASTIKDLERFKDELIAELSGASVKGEKLVNPVNRELVEKILAYIIKDNNLNRGRAILDEIAKGEPAPFNLLSIEQRDRLIRILYTNFKRYFLDINNSRLVPKAIPSVFSSLVDIDIATNIEGFINAVLEYTNPHKYTMQDIESIKQYVEWVLTGEYSSINYNEARAIVRALPQALVSKKLRTDLGIIEVDETDRLTLLKAYAAHMEKVFEQKRENSKDSWGTIVVTAGSVGMKELYENYLERLRGVLYSKETRVVVISDPPGARVGNGGATAWAFKELRKQFGQNVFDEPILLVHAGGFGKRLPETLHDGTKALSQVPRTLPNGQPSTSLAEAIRNTYAAYDAVKQAKGGVFIVTCDGFFVHDYKRFTLTKEGINVISAPMGVERIAQGLGVAHDKDGVIDMFYEKKSRGVLAAAFSTDENYLINGVMSANTAFYFVPKGKIDEVMGLWNFVDNSGMEIDTGGDILTCMATDIAEDDYVDGKRLKYKGGFPEGVELIYRDAFKAYKKIGKAYNVRATNNNIFDDLVSTDVYVGGMSNPLSQVFGWEETLVSQINWTENRGGYIADSTLDGGKIDSKSWVVGSDLVNCHIGKKSLVYGVEGSRWTIGNNESIFEAFITDKAGKPIKVVVWRNVNDDPKKGTLFGQNVADVAVRGDVDLSTLSDSQKGELLWNAPIWPLIEEPDQLEVALEWMKDKNLPAPQSYKVAPKVSMAEITSMLDYKRIIDHREGRDADRAARLAHKDEARYTHMLGTANSAGLLFEEYKNEKNIDKKRWILTWVLNISISDNANARFGARYVIGEILRLENIFDQEYADIRMALRSLGYVNLQDALGSDNIGVPAILLKAYYNLDDKWKDILMTFFESCAKEIETTWDARSSGLYLGARWILDSISKYAPEHPEKSTI